MDNETNKSLMRRYIEMWNTGNVEIADCAKADFL